MAEFNDEAKPIWITETGVSTAQGPIQDADYQAWLSYSANRILGSGVTPNVAILSVPGFPGDKAERNLWVKRQCTALGWSTEFVDISQLQQLSYPGTRIIAVAQEEYIPEAVQQTLIQFATDGGLIVAVSRLPFYHAAVDNNGVWSTVSPNLHYNLHMDFTCSWRNSQVPSIVNDAVTYADTGLPASHWLSSLGANRFFTEARLQGQDTVIPLLSNPGLTATAQELIAPVVLYDYDSSLTGGMLIIGGMMPNIMADDAVQARLLPRNYLQYFAAGIDGLTHKTPFATSPK